MPQRILGIDAGAWSVKGVLIESGFRAFKVVAAKEVLVPDGEPESHTERQAAALRHLFQDGSLRADATVALLPGESATVRFLTLPFTDPKKIEQTLPGELADVLPFDLDETVFDHELLEKKADGTATVLASAAPKPRVKKYLEQLSAGGAEARFLGVDVLSLFNLYTHFLSKDASKAEAPTQAAPDANTFIAAAPGGPPDARLVVDIGHERTLVAAAGEHGVAHVRVIRHGGKDITQAIAQAYNLDWMDAEAGKHEDGLVASARHPAPSDAAQKMSEVVHKGLQPLVRELRRTIQAIRGEKKVRVARVDLLGGGARIKNLPNYLAEQLNVPVAAGLAVEQIVERSVDAPRRGAFALALAASLRPGAEEPVSRIELRRGDFAYAGQLQHLRRRAPAIGYALSTLGFLLLGHVILQYRVASVRESALDAQFCSITKQIVGREICEPSLAVSVVKQPPSELGSFKLPERSAFRVAVDVSRLSKDVEITLDELEVMPDRVRMSGEAASFDAVDQLVAAYAADKCFSEIKKAKLEKKANGTGVDFSLTMKVGCSQ